MFDSRHSAVNLDSLFIAVCLFPGVITAGEIAGSLRVDPQAWKAEYFEIESFFDPFGNRLPDRLKTQLQGLKKRLRRA